MKQNELVDQTVIDQILADQPARRVITKQSHPLFFHLYFYEYTEYETAEFHHELFDITEDDKLKIAIVVAFRGSGKSTILTQSYPIWAILGRQQKKCVVILSKTRDRVKDHFSNIRQILETNDLLKQDLGPFQEESDEWGAYSIIIPRFNAKIIAVSSEQNIRGIRYGAHRPDLVICDDIEDVNSVKTKEGRDANFHWLTSEIMQIGDKKTKYIVVGNLLHSDSIIMRLKDRLTEFPPETTTYIEIPIIYENGEYAWKGKYKNEADMKIQHLMAGDEKTWQREYMLKIIADEDQIILPEWIKYYDELPQDTSDYSQTIVAVDLAVKTGQNNDYTAMITAHIFGNLESMKIYIEPNPINRRMDAPTTMEMIKDISRLIYYNRRPEVYTEDVAFQYAMIQHLEKQGVGVNGFKVHGQDKGTRLNATSHLVRTGQVLFPRKGAEDLIQQLVYFGTEKYDDLADAFSMIIAVAVKKDRFPVKLYHASILA